MKPVLVVIPPFWEITEAFGFGVYRAFKSANSNLVIIARINHHYIVRADQAVPVFGFDIVANGGQWIHIWLAKGHDLFFQSDFHFAKWGVRGGGFFPFEIRTARQHFYVRQNRINARARTGNRAIDPFFCEQQRPLNILCQAQIKKRRLNCGGVMESGELIESGDRVHGSALRAMCRSIQASFCAMEKD